MANINKVNCEYAIGSTNRKYCKIGKKICTTRCINHPDNNVQTNTRGIK